MPISSAEIAQMAMMNYQQNSMMQSSFGRADQFAGHAANFASGVAAPGAVGAMGMMGLDPMSLGISAGMSAFSGSGVMGALTGGAGLGLAGSMGVGLGVAGAAALPMMAAGYAGNQMMHGAQQQQQLNATLSRSFGFQNQMGRRGFGRGDVSQIGASMREMSHEVGPGGELTSMKELTDLAGKMGQMGMGKGVRDAQEFNTKFREMIKTVKSVATEMNTSLSQAMEFMQASKSSGMFQQADQLKFARQVQSTAMSSGLATSEVAAMGNIGSQISRAYGGLGKQGAMGGMKAIGQVGGALQAGAISEEDIYNATGQTGAEGRQALATNMMSKTGEFLKSGKGRWFMASMAGENGSINEGDAQRYMLGNLGTGDTRQMAGKNLNEVGRASFIRNEGRLRGAVMEKFGAMAPAMALSGWASQRGIDINNMDDRSMLFAQRQLGMGRDEMDVAVKMAQDMPRIMQQQQQQGDLSKHGQRLGMEQKNKGVEGLKRRFDHAKEKLNAGLQQAGADMYNDLTNTVDRWLESWMGTAVPAATENLSTIWRETLKGGKANDVRANAILGGGKANAARDELLTSMGGGAGDMSLEKGSKMSWQEFSGQNKTADKAMSFEANAATFGMSGLYGVGMKLGGLLGGAGETGKRMKKAGYGGRIEEIGKLEGDEQQKALDKMLSEGSAVQRAVTEGVEAVSVEGDFRKKLFQEYAKGAVGKEGLDRRGAEVEKVMEREAAKGDKHAQDLLKQYRESDNPASKAAMIAGMEKNMGIDSGSNSLASMGEKLGSLESATEEKMRGLKTQTDRDEYMGNLLGGGGERGSFWGSVGKGAATGAAATFWMGGVGAIPGAVIGGASYYLGGGSEAKRMDAGVAKYARSEEGMQLQADIMSRSDAGIEKGQNIIQAARAVDATQDEKQKAVVARNAMMANEIRDEMKAAGVKDIEDFSDTTKEKLFKSYKDQGGEGEDYESMISGVRGQMSLNKKQQEENNRVISKTLKEAATSEGGRMVGMGIMTKNKKGQYELSAETKKKLKEGKDDSTAAAMLQLEILNAEASEDPKQVAVIRAKSAEKQNLLGKMSIEKLSQHVKDYGDADAAVLLSDTKRLKSLSRSQGGMGGGIAAFMGVGGGETRSEKRSLQTAYGKGEEAFIAEYMKQNQLQGDAATKMRDALKGEEGIYQKSKKGGALDNAALSSAMDAVKRDPKMKEELDKKADAKKSPSERSLGNMEKSLAKMSESLTPTGIGTAVSTAVTTAAPTIGAAIKAAS